MNRRMIAVAMALAPVLAWTPATPQAQGRPDFSGVYTPPAGGGLFEAVVDGNNVTVLIRAREASSRQEAGAVNIERDAGLTLRADPNLPLYKPEFWEKVHELDKEGNAMDPTFSCMPFGVPRMGPPQKIVQTDREFIFLYAASLDAGLITGNVYRVIPIGRPVPPVEKWDATWMGQSFARWEGDTLVIETVGFNDASWLGWAGYFHSENMRVIERLRKDGSSIHYQATVIDPDVLQEPWVMNPRILRLNPDPDAMLEEQAPCSERDLKGMVTKERG